MFLKRINRIPITVKGLHFSLCGIRDTELNKSMSKENVCSFEVNLVV